MSPPYEVPRFAGTRETGREKVKHYDVVIIGAGPNGLVAGAYLAKAGLKVLLLEKRTEAGGGLATEEVTLPGCLHNTHSVYHMMVDYAPPYRDLGLEALYGCRYLHPPLQFAMPLADGRCLCLYTDVEKSCQSLAQFSRRDAEAYREVHHRLRRYMDEFLAPATYVPPMAALEQLIKLQQTDLGRELIAYAEKSPQEIVEELFEHEQVRTLMLYAACHFGIEHDETGIGYLAFLYLERATHYRLCVGGSHILNQALHKALIAHGGMIWGSQRIKRIILEDGTAKGVELEEGTVIEAERVISSIDPHQTFLQLVGEEHLEQEFAEKIRGWQWEKWSLLGIHLALKERPHFSVADSDAGLDNAFVYVLGYETVQDLIEEWKAFERGELRGKAGFHCSFPTVHDPSQAPAGRHTGLINRMAPYRLKGGAQGWYSLPFKEELTEASLALLHSHAPNLTRDKVLWTYVSTPLDIENKFSNMVQGSLKQGAYTPLQMGYLRPNEDCSQSRTPIKHLYLCGSCTHPGGLITLGGGYVAANAIAEELGLDKWWPEPEMVVRARQRGML